jgi:hypothetical protein
MDALKFIEERNRMCERYWQVDGDCDGCPMLNVDECNELRSMVDDAGKAVGKVVEIVEKWSKEHPRKTRQSKFLDMFPAAGMDDVGVLNVCPVVVDDGYKDGHCGNRAPFSCQDCRRKFWMQEVE